MPVLRLKGDEWEERDFLSLSSNVCLVYKNNSERLNDQEERTYGCSHQRLPPFPPSRDVTLVSQRGDSLNDYFIQGLLFLMRQLKPQEVSQSNPTEGTLHPGDQEISGK